MAKDHFTVKFWGVRGTITTPGTRTIRYGGNTSCVEITCGERTIICDMGTGLYPLGEQPHLQDFDILLSHTHIDHILGFPFFSPAYKEGNKLRLWAGHLAPEMTLRDTMARLMSPPLFPLTLDFLSADIQYNDFQAGENVPSQPLIDAGVTIRTLPLHHPDRATAYRIEYQGKSVCYVTDVEHRNDELDSALIDFIRDSNVFIYDSTFDDANFAKFEGWGHSTWQHGARLADAANVETYTPFHHDPGMDDDALDARLEQLLLTRPHDRMAREGLVIQL